MGAALATLHTRAGLPTALLGTRYDEAIIDACTGGRAHPVLGVVLDHAIECAPYDRWPDVLPRAERVVLAVSSEGLADVVAEAVPLVRKDAIWLVATKGWDGSSLLTPSELLRSAAERGRVVVLAGPALAPELVAGAPVAMVCASADGPAAAEVAAALGSAGVATSVTDDVAGAEIGAAYKNVVAIAVGMCEGLSEQLPERVYVHVFANARAAMFALGLLDMWRLAQPRGGRLETIAGLAGAGDLYVTCLGGRNGNMGRLLGAGQTADQAQVAIGSTVEGVANTGSALALAGRLGVELVVARVVDSVLSGRATPEDAIAGALRSLAGS